MMAGKLNAISTRPPLAPSNDGSEAVGNTLGMAILVSGSAAGAGEAGGMERLRMAAMAMGQWPDSEDLKG